MKSCGGGGCENDLLSTRDEILGCLKDADLLAATHTVRGANPTLYARKKLSGLFEKFPKVQLENKKGEIPPQDAEHQNYLILDHYYIYFWRPCPCDQGRVGSLYFACTFI